MALSQSLEIPQRPASQEEVEKYCPDEKEDSGSLFVTKMDASREMPFDVLFCGSKKIFEMNCPLLKTFMNIAYVTRSRDTDMLSPEERESVTSTVIDRLGPAVDQCQLFVS